MLAWPAFANRAFNPYNSLLYDAVGGPDVTVDEFTVGRALKGRYDIWHLHWPDAFVVDNALPAAFAKSQILFGLLRAARARGTRIIWTAHNLESHSARHPRFERYFWKAFLRQIDGVMALSQSGLTAAQQRYPELRGVIGTVVPHGHYVDAYPRDIGRAEARSRLNIPDDHSVLLFFGRVRRYKGCLDLMRAFRGVTSPTVLRIVGMPEDDEFATEIADTARLDSRVDLEFELVDEEAAQLHFRSAGLVVLPYKRVLNSGAAILALSFDRPVLVPDVPALRELQAEVGDTWVRLFESPLDTRDIQDAIAWSESRPESARPNLSALDWEHLAGLTVDGYRKVMVQNGRAKRERQTV